MRNVHHLSSFFFFFNDTATTEIYTLSLHDALPIYEAAEAEFEAGEMEKQVQAKTQQSLTTRVIQWWYSPSVPRDRKSTRLNSSHGYISYAVFCLKKKKK